MFYSLLQRRLADLVHNILVPQFDSNDFLEVHIAGVSV